MRTLYLNTTGLTSFGRDVRFKHLKRHQKPVVFKYRVLIIIYFPHVFLLYHIYIYYIYIYITIYILNVYSYFGNIYIYIYNIYIDI